MRRGPGGITELTLPRLGTVAFACAWILSGALDALHAPGWTLFVGGSMIVAASAVVSVSLHLTAPPPNGDGRGPGHWGEDGGRGPGGPSPQDPQGGGDSEPRWWPQIECEFAGYVARQDRERILMPAARSPASTWLSVQISSASKQPRRGPWVISASASTTVLRAA